MNVQFEVQPRLRQSQGEGGRDEICQVVQRLRLKQFRVFGRHFQVFLGQDVKAEAVRQSSDAVDNQHEDALRVIGPHDEE